MSNKIQKTKSKTVVVNDEGEKQKFFRVSFSDESYDFFSRKGTKKERKMRGTYDSVKCTMTAQLKIDSNSDIVEDALCRHNINPFNFSFEVCGYAYMDDIDEWDEVKGKHIAQTRAKKNAYNRALNVVTDIINDTLAFTKTLENSNIFYQYMIDDEVRHCKDLISGK